MKRITIILASWLCLLMDVVAQEVEVKYLALTHDVLNESQWMKDLDGDYCSLIKIRTTRKIDRVEGSIVGELIDRGSEKWIFLTSGTKLFKLFLEGWLPVSINCEDYNIVRFEGKSIYSLAFNETQTKGSVQKPLVISDSSMVRIIDDWYKVNFDVNLPFCSAVLQDTISKVLFGGKETSLELAYRKNLTEQAAFRSMKDRQSLNPKNSILYDVRSTYEHGKYANIIVHHTTKKQIPRPDRVRRGSFDIDKRDDIYSYIYDTENDKILTLSDIFVPETVYQLETLAERRSSYGSIVMQISLTNVGIKVEFFKKGLQGVPVGKRIRSCFFIFNKDLEKLTDEFRSNFDMPMDVYSAFAKSNMNISDTIVLKKDSLSIRVTCVTDILIDNWENKDGKQLFEIISKRPKFPISKPMLLRIT